MANNSNVTSPTEPSLSYNTTSFATTEPLGISYGLGSDEMLTVALLSEGLLVAAIFFTIAIFHYSKTSQQKTLQFNCCYKILSILIVFLLFFLMVSALTYPEDLTGLHIGISIVLILLLITIIITNVIGIMDYRYMCLDVCLKRMDGLHENKCCQKILYIIITLFSLLLIFISFNKDAIKHEVQVLVPAFCISILCAAFNRVSSLIAVTMIFTFFFGFLWMEETSNDTAHKKYLIYGFPMILIIFLFHALICCRNNKQNKAFFRKHVGYNVFVALLGILNRATNVAVMFIWLSQEKAGFFAIVQLFFILFTAIISTVSVSTNVDASNNGNVVLDDDENDVMRLKKYFCLGKVFTFFSWGRLWFEMATWDRNKKRDDIMNGYHMIKMHELMFECLPSLSLQIIVCITVFVHQTVGISIFICVLYITLTVIAIVYDEISFVDDVVVHPQIELAITNANGNGTVSNGGETHSVVRSRSVDAPEQSIAHSNDISWKGYCSVLNCVLFIWSDYLIRIVPIWLLSTAAPLLCALHIIILFVMNNIFYWRMIAKTDGFKCINIILFGWSGIISGSFYYLSSMEIKYIPPVNHNVFCIEHWLRLSLSLFVVFVAFNKLTGLFGALFLLAFILNIGSGLRVYFGCCFKKQTVAAQQAMPNV